MFKTKFKIAIATAIAGVIVGGHAVYAASVPAGTPLSETTSDGIYTVETAGGTLSVDKKTLNLSVEREGKTWYSGKRASEEDGLNNLWASKLTDAITVGYRRLGNNNWIAAEQAMSRLGGAVKFTGRKDGFDAVVRCSQISLTFTMQVRLLEDSLTVTVPYDTIKEESDSNKLEYLLVYPFFDSSYKNVEGQILLPDGSGAVIDLSQPTLAKQSYTSRVFGDDYGISAAPITPTSPSSVTMPVFATLYPEGGTMFTADNGAEYCSVNAMVSSITTNYNFAYFSWIYRQQFTKYYESSGTEGKFYNDLQPDKNKFDLVQTMTFLDGDCGVADVARAYRDKLGLKKTDNGASSAGLRLQFLMAENKQGMFGDKVIAMTTTSYIEKVAEQVSGYCDNLSIALLGYTKGGLNGSYPNNFPIESKTGGKKGYKSLANKLSSKGISLSFVTDYVKAYEDASIRNKKLALNISNQFITIGDNRSGSSAQFRLVNPQDAMSLFKDDISTIKGYSAAADVASASSLLYSGYKNRDYSRSDTVAIFKEAMKNAGIRTNMIRPNSYLWPECSAYLDVPVSSSEYLIETESVPFLQMTLSGIMPMYSDAINLTYTGSELVLRLIDYNVYPSFTLTEEDAIELYGSNSSGIFTSSYSLWKDSVESIYGQVNAVLSKVAGQQVADRYPAADGVYVTEYTNGYSIVVNYGAKPFEFGGTTVEAKSAAAVKA